MDLSVRKTDKSEMEINGRGSIDKTIRGISSAYDVYTRR
jgi:hypothetical protein